jgi:hypothetical protein
MNRGGYLAGGMPEVIDLETEVPDDTSSFDSSDDSPANFFRQDKELQQSRPEMFQQKTYKPYTAWEDEPTAAPARPSTSRPMAYASSEPESRSPAMDAISGATDSDRPAPPRPIPPGNIPNVPQAKNVDPRLFSILNAAGQNLPQGWSWNVTPSGGFRPGDPRFHGKGMAVDVQLVDDQGKPLPNYQNAAAFRAYEQFAQAARKAQLDLHPELSSQLRWGGYFSGPVGKYGAKDLMHFDLGGDRIPMGGGSWDTGLHERERRYLPGAKSVGMGNYAKGGRADRQQKAGGGISYSGDFSTPDYYQVYNALPGAGMAGQILQKMFPNPTTTGAYDAYMKQLSTNTAVPPTPNTTYAPASQDPRYAYAPSTQTAPLALFDPSKFGFGQNMGGFSAPTANWLPQDSAAPQAAAAPMAPMAPMAAEKKANGGSIADRAIMVMSRQAQSRRGRP